MHRWRAVTASTEEMEIITLFLHAASEPGINAKNDDMVSKKTLRCNTRAVL